MSVTPLMKLKQNMGSIKFDCDPKFIPEYKRAFSSVLDRMDDYFVKNDLYKAVDYNKIVDELLEGKTKFGFHVALADDELMKKRNWAGFHRKNYGIAMSENFMGKDKTTEGVLCHEFFHYLTLGPDVLTYKDRGHDIEVHLPTRGVIRQGGTKIDITAQKADGLSAGTALDGGFICEGLTELSKQEIYSEEECAYSYPAQTAMVKLLDKLSGNKFDMRQFLRGDLPNYVSALGKDENGKNVFDNFDKHCEAFQKKFEANNSIDHTKDEDYIAAQDIVVNAFLDKVYQNPENYTVEQFVDMAATILAFSPAKSNGELATKYMPMITNARNAVVRAQQGLSTKDKGDLSKAINTAIYAKINADREEVEIKNAPDFKFKKTKNGYSFNYKKGYQITNGDFPTNYTTGKLIQQKNDTVKLETLKNGKNVVTTTEQGKKPTSITLEMDKSGNLISTSNENQSTVRTNIDAKVKKQKKDAKTLKNIAQNYNQKANIERIIKTHGASKVGNVRLCNSENGQYLMVSGSRLVEFYKVDENGCNPVKSKRNENVSGLNVVTPTKVSLANSASGATFTMDRNTGVITDEDSVGYELEDGTTFVEYIDENNDYVVGQQKDNKVREIENPILYDRSNKQMSDVFTIEDEAVADASQTSPPVTNVAGDQLASDESGNRGMYRSQRQTQASNYAYNMQREQKEHQTQQNRKDESEMIEEQIVERNQNVQDQISEQDYKADLYRRALLAGMTKEKIDKMDKFYGNNLQFIEEEVAKREALREAEIQRQMREQERTTREVHQSFGRGR